MRVVPQSASIVKEHDEFLERLAREQGTARRSRSRYSLILYELRRRGGRRMQQEASLKRTLRRRVRSTDVVGWVDDRRIGVLLLNTTEDGARALSHDVSRTMWTLGRVPVCRICTHLDSSGSVAMQSTMAGDTHGACVGSVDLVTADSRVSDLREDVATRSETLAGVTGLCVGVVPAPMPRWKRAMDVLGAAVGLILLAPLFLGVAGFVKAVSPGPAFYKQTRVGLHGKPFTFWKFRTMHEGAETSVHQRYFKNIVASGVPMRKLDRSDDSRIIPLGKLLRQASVDELPQLFNVLMGDMSLVGPRPCIEYEAESYEPWQRARFDAVPGMTGLWQVSGKNRLTFKQMVRLDISYGRSLSFVCDVGILLRTVPAVLSELRDGLARRAAAAAGNAAQAAQSVA